MVSRLADFQNHQTSKLDIFAKSIDRLRASHCLLLGSTPISIQCQVLACSAILIAAILSHLLLRSS